MEKKYKIYKHTSPSGKVYIGQTSQNNPVQRWRNGGKGYFRKNPKTQDFQQPAMVNAIMKYPWNLWTHEIIDYADTQEQADFLEQLYIQQFKSTDPKFGYNITSGGGGHHGQPMLQSTRSKLSEAIKQLWNDPQYRQRVISNMQGRSMHENTKAALLKANTGRTLSQETKAKIGKANSEKVLQFSLNGTLLYEYDSCKAASISINKTASAISNCCTGKSKKCSSYLFLYKKDYDLHPEILDSRLKIIKDNRKNVKQIVQQSLDGKFINQYPSVSEASKCVHVSITSISNCLRGYSKSAGGFIWKYYGN